MLDYETATVGGFSLPSTFNQRALAAVRRGTDFLCFAKESQQRKATPHQVLLRKMPSLRTIGKAAGFNKTEPAEFPCRLFLARLDDRGNRADQRLRHIPAMVLL